MHELLLLVFLLCAMTAIWLASVAFEDSSIVDFFWGAGFAAIAWAVAITNKSAGLRVWVILFLVSLWALRLGSHMLRRHAGEDRRYAAMRLANGQRWWWQSLFQVFWLQALLIWFISWPLRYALTAATPIRPLDFLGFGLIAGGIFIEAVADLQLANFRAHNENRERVLRRGLWALSRHPNYFGNAIMWWGFYLVALASSFGALWTIVCPALMTWLLLRVSGVALMEEGIVERRPDYADYIASTRAFLPLPVQSTVSQNARR